jgi:hypothetical protein
MLRLAKDATRVPQRLFWVMSALAWGPAPNVPNASQQKYVFASVCVGLIWPVVVQVHGQLSFWHDQPERRDRCEARLGFDPCHPATLGRRMSDREQPPR